MKSIYIRGGDAKEPGVLVLKEHLENKGHRVVRRKDGQDYDVVVCWGASMRDPLVKRVPALNGHVNSFDKYAALDRFVKAGIRTPEFFSVERGMHHEYNDPFPWFARKFHHEKGNDIRVCRTRKDVERVFENRSHDFFSVYIPHDQELRAWVYKNKVFAVYHKQYRVHDVENYKRMEFRSELRDDLLNERALIAPATNAVEALRMDFGAVDILHGEDGKYYVLEVNSMPDISSTIRVSGIRLANIISDWAQAQR